MRTVAGLRVSTAVPTFRNTRAVARPVWRGTLIVEMMTPVAASMLAGTNRVAARLRLGQCSRPFPRRRRRARTLLPLFLPRGRCAEYAQSGARLGHTTATQCAAQVQQHRPRDR